MDILQTDWAALTLNDWTGLIITVGVFFLMIWAYVYTFNPKNKEKLESQRTIIFEEDDDMDVISTDSTSTHAKSTHATSTHVISTNGDSKNE